MELQAFNTTFFAQLPSFIQQHDKIQDILSFLTNEVQHIISEYILPACYFLFQKTKRTILFHLQQYGFVKLIGVDRIVRRGLHEWFDELNILRRCEKQLTHVAYYESQFKTEKTLSKYWCSTCNQYKSDQRTRMHYCCTDFFGNQICDEWNVLCMQCDTVVYNESGYENPNFKRKSGFAPNCLLIFEDSPKTTKNRGLICSIGMKLQTVLKKTRRKHNN